MPEQSLSENELYIMEFFWDVGPMKSDQLAQHVAQKGWKPTTLLTFLSRLATKGLLQVQKNGKTNIYTPAVSKAEYQSREGRTFLNQLYGGSAKNFLSALVDAQGLSTQDIQELREWLDSQESTDE